MRTFSSGTHAPATCRVAKLYGTLGGQFATRRWSAAILCFLDPLARQEWDGRSALVRHEKDGPKMPDCCALIQSRFDFQALLQRIALMAAGARSFHSGHTQAFYHLLLNPRSVRDPLGSAVQPTPRAEGDATSLAWLKTAPPRVKRFRKDAQPVVGSGCRGSRSTSCSVGFIFLVLP